MDVVLPSGHTVTGVPAKIKGIECLLFEDVRDHRLVPVHPDFPEVYVAQHPENDWTFPALVYKPFPTTVGVNRWGTILSAQPFPMDEHGVVEVNEIEKEDGTQTLWTEEDEREHMEECLNGATKVETSDGFILSRQPDGSWSDGDLSFSDDAALLNADLEITVQEY